MSCYRPLPAYRDKDGRPKVGRTAYAFDRDVLEFACGRCVGCKLDRARTWSVRLMHERQMWDHSWFVTFTYDDKFLPVGNSLKYEDFQRFMYRLRTRLKRRVPFFCAGEYGSQRKRPHYHAILFNWCSNDLRSMMNGSYMSSSLERTWKLGNIQIDEVNECTAAYVARYTLEKASRENWYEYGVDPRTGEVFDREKEFVRMSLRPAIGLEWFRKFRADLFPHDFAVVAGKRNKVPRYYWEKFKLDGDPQRVEEVEYERYLRAKSQRAESAPERRAVREELSLRRVKEFQSRMDL